MNALEGVFVLVVLGALVGGPLWALLVLFNPFLDEEDRRYREALRPYGPVAECEALMKEKNPELYKEYIRGKERREGGE